MEQVLFQNLPGISPSHGSQLVGLAIVPQGSIQAVAVVAANLEHFRQVGRTAEDGHARTLSGVVHAKPADTSHGIRKPVAQLDDGRVRTLRHGYVAVGCHGTLLQGIEQLYLVGTHPRVGTRAGNGISLSGFSVFDSHFQVFRYAPFCTFIRLAQVSHHVGIADFLFRFYTQRQFLIVHAKLERRSQCAQNEELADAECLHFAEIVRTSVGFPELERFLAIPQLEFLGHAEHVFRCHIVTCILQVECADA